MAGPQQIAQLTEQVQLLTNQVRHLNTQTDAQATRLQVMADYEQLKAELIQLKKSGVASGGATEQGKYLINIKDVKIENFTGEESRFPDFVEDTKTYSDVINPELGEMLEWLEYQEKTMTENLVLSKVGQDKLISFNRLLSGFMKVRLKGKARNWLKAQPVGEGVMNWKRMLHKYDPMTGSSRLDMQNKITTPGA